MLTRAQIEDRAKYQLRYLAWYCMPSIPAADVWRFNILLLLVGDKLDTRALSDESLAWVHELYCNPQIKKSGSAAVLR